MVAPDQALVLPGGFWNEVRDRLITVAIKIGEITYKVNEPLVIGFTNDRACYTARVDKVQHKKASQVTAQEAIDAGYVDLPNFTTLFRNAAFSSNTLNDMVTVVTFTRL